MVEMRPRSEYTTDQLVDLCLAIRRPKDPLRVTREHVLLIEQLAADLRGVREANPGASRPPSDEVERRLRVVGWLMYEVSLQSLKSVPSASEAAEYDSFIDHVANSARFLAWREFSPRSLGAIRAQALASSKRDTDAGYARAWLFHREADFLHDLYRSQVSGDQTSGDQELEWGYLETLVQLRLAETGTACRTAEHAIIQQFDRGARSTVPEKARINKLFRDLEAGAQYGKEAIDAVRKLHERPGPGLVEAVDEHRLALGTSYRNPGIMTARAYLLMYPVTAFLQKQKRTWGDMSTWAEARKSLLEQFVEAYRAVETRSSTTKLSEEHQRSIVQLRLNLALVHPGFELTSELSPELDLDPEFASCVERSVLDADAIDELSRWLADDDNKGNQRGDANVIGSATMPSYLESIRLVLSNDDDDEDWMSYLAWRRKWLKLDRYAARKGRKRLVLAALDAAATSRRP